MTARRPHQPAPCHLFTLSYTAFLKITFKKKKNCYCFKVLQRFHSQDKKDVSVVFSLREWKVKQSSILLQLQGPFHLNAKWLWYEAMAWIFKLGTCPWNSCIEKTYWELIMLWLIQEEDGKEGRAKDPIQTFTVFILWQALKQQESCSESKSWWMLLSGDTYQ